MKFSSSQPNQFSGVLKKRGSALDISFPNRNAASVLPLRQERVLSRPSMISGKRILDGVRREKRAFLLQLKERSPSDVLWRFVRKYELYSRRIKRMIIRCVPSIAPHKMLYGSLIGGIAFGMVSMAFMEHFFGPGVFARSQESEQTAVNSQVAGVSTSEENVNIEQTYDSGSDIFLEYFNETADAEYKENVKKLVAGYPIAEMLSYIFEQDRITAAFLIGIAKKESNWGKRVPVLNNQDCFNYWGYRGVRRMMGSGGHTCFNSRKDAVETVAKRLNTLINSEKLNTPEKMIIWKCGFSCAGHSRESVKKWISDVDNVFSNIEKLSDE
jgi:hypothetical protein